MATEHVLFTNLPQPSPHSLTAHRKHNTGVMETSSQLPFSKTIFQNKNKKDSLLDFRKYIFS